MGLKGRAYVYGVGASPAIAYTGFATPAGGDVTDTDLKDSSTVNRLKSGQGRLAGFHTAERELQLTINFYPMSIAASNQTVAQALEAMQLPVGPCKVTVSGLNDVAATQVNGDWIYETGGSVNTSDGVCKMTLPLFKIVGMTSDQLTALLTDRT